WMCVPGPHEAAASASTQSAREAAARRVMGSKGGVVNRGPAGYRSGFEEPRKDSVDARARPHERALAPPPRGRPDGGEAPPADRRAPRGWKRPRGRERGGTPGPETLRAAGRL